jgi:hypothetical protein
MLMRRIDRPCPPDFREQFVKLGRLQCEEHYRARRSTITRWLEECGKREMIELRKAFVREKRREGMRRREMQKILLAAYGDPDEKVSPIVASQAQRYLQRVRNGGWIVTRAGDGLWWVGSRRRTAAELVELAKAAGFEPNLSGESEEG